jgi:hypothetical protein
MDRRCKRHGVVISSPDGLYDAPCGRCEAEANEPSAVSSFPRGTLVRALRELDSAGAKVAAGELGVVFEEAGYYGDCCGPIVRWVSGGCCNVGDEDVKAV